ncbi:MAG: heparinase II/III family protein, partial [Pirellulaceae bacterium]
PVREETRSTLLPGYGHASLGRGRGANQLQAQLHFSGAFGHSHADNLNLALFAKQSELFSDIGYNHGKLRHWTTSTVGHNTVVIDRRDQVERESDGDLLMFVPGLAGVSVAEAGGERGYPRRASLYRRMLILVPVSDTDAYVVDVFQVRGGATHDWLLHGSADADMSAECSLEMSDPVADLLEPGEKWSEPIGESSTFIPYGLIRDVRRATSGEPFHVTFRYSGGQAPMGGTGVRTHMLGAPDTQVLLGNSPRIRQAEREDSKVYDYLMPQLVVRRRGAAPLASTFVAVHEPFRDQGWLESVQSLPLPSDDASAVALQVRHGDAIDTILCTAGDDAGRSVRLANGRALDGRLAIVRERAGRLEQAWLIDGRRLTWGERSIQQEPPRYEGAIESSERKADGAAVDAFVTSQPLPDGDALAGQWLIVTHGNGMTHGFEIERVERKDDRYVVVLRDDHGLLIAGNRTEEYYFPRRTFLGPNRFVVHAATHWPMP